MPEEIAQGVNGVDLCYETIGDPADPPLLLIMGMGGQLVWWDDGLCAEFAGRGFHVIRYDNRDIGRSTRQHGAVGLGAAYLRRRSPYTLDDLADDAAALLEHLGSGRAHVAGVSMGGMIGQLLAIRRPDLVRSLTSIMSSTGNRRAGWPTRRGLAAIMAKPAKTREEYVESLLNTFRVIGSPGVPFDADRIRARARRSFDRGLNPAGVARQLSAVLAAPDRTPRLRGLRIPAAVVHGADDPLIGLSGGLATMRAIPGAELHVMNGMGHDLHPAYWTWLAGIIERTAARTVPA